MALAIRKIKRQIRSVKNTQKITKAMEMVSAGKMRKAVASALLSREYSETAWKAVLRIAQKSDPALHPLLNQSKEIKKIGILLLSSNRGLCGGFNQQIIKKTLSFVAAQAPSAELEFITYGRKGAVALSKNGLLVAADFPKSEVLSDLSEMRFLSQAALNGFLVQKYDRVVLVFTDFISPLKQKPVIKQFLPLNLAAISEDEKKLLKEIEEQDQIDGGEYLFEPNADFVLRIFLPRLLELQIYQAVLESNASEHSSRMLAMRNASDAAGGLLSDLTLGFNKARQTGITQELSEISVSKASLE